MEAYGCCSGLVLKTKPSEQFKLIDAKTKRKETISGIISNMLVSEHKITMIRTKTPQKHSNVHGQKADKVSSSHIFKKQLN